LTRRIARSRPTLGYPEALAALESRGRFGIHLGLARTRALLAALDHPERSFRGALIAGTNGKGSVLAMVAAALQAAGYRTGATPKPHLVTYRERLQIDGLPVDPETFGRVAGDVLALADRVARRHGEPTEFELLTAITFRWFAEAWEMYEKAHGTERDYALQELRVVVYENPTARKPLPKEMFRGPYDERYGGENGYITRLYAGAKILEMEKLEAEFPDHLEEYLRDGAGESVG